MFSIYRRGSRRGDSSTMKAEHCVHTQPPRNLREDERRSRSVAAVSLGFFLRSEARADRERCSELSAERVWPWSFKATVGALSPAFSAGQDLQLQARILEASASGSSKRPKVSTGQGSGGCCSCEAINIGPSAENVGPVLFRARQRVADLEFCPQPANRARANQLAPSMPRWDTRDATSSLWVYCLVSEILHS